MVTVAYKKKTVFGNLRVVILKATDVTNADTITVAGMKSIQHISFCPYGVALAAFPNITWSGNTITFVATSNSGTDDYYLMIIGV